MSISDAMIHIQEHLSAAERPLLEDILLGIDGVPPPALWCGNGTLAVGSLRRRQDPHRELVGGRAAVLRLRTVGWPLIAVFVSLVL